MSDEQDDLRVTPYLPDESQDGSLGQASADAPGFVGPSDPSVPVVSYPSPSIDVPAYPAPVLPPAMPEVPLVAAPPVPASPPPRIYPTPDGSLSFTLAPFPGSERERPFPSNIKDHFGIAAVICGCASIAILVVGAQMAMKYFAQSDAATALFGVVWLGLWLVASVAAIVLGVTGIKAANRNEASNRWVAITGLVIGAMMIAFVVLAIAIGVSSP